jgi:hypothetical protein
VKWKAFAHRRLAVTVALIAAAALVLGGNLQAGAGPLPQVDPDGKSNQSLRDQLDAAARAYNDAKGRLDVSHAKQGELELQLQGAERRLRELDSEVGAVASAAYRGARVSVTEVFLHGGSTVDVLHDAATVEYLALRDDREIHELLRVRADYAGKRAALDAEVKVQEQQVAEMEKRKKDAEKALGNPRTGTAPAGNQKPSATPARRNPDGSWPAESCSLKDPTTSGCLTARTLHALNEARAAGFNHFTACFRGGSFGEHPKGRACDFAANASGFVDARATGDDKAYGDRLAGWCIANADRIAVLYVIWYKQIWFPGLGWRAYTSGDGTPAGDHYNHVHLSVH